MTEDRESRYRDLARRHARLLFALAIGERHACFDGKRDFVRLIRFEDDPKAAYCRECGKQLPGWPPPDSAD
jgi:hypothetical protein